MTQEQLAEIEARYQALCFPLFDENQSKAEYMSNTAGSLDDIPDLIAEVRRLREELEAKQG